MTDIPEPSSLLLDRQLPDFVTSYDKVSETGKLIREVSEHLLHWTALQIEKHMPIGYPLDQIDSCDHEPVRRLDHFLQQMTINTQINGLEIEEVMRIHRVVTADDMVVMGFVHSLVQYLYTHWDKAVVDEAAIGIISSSAHWSTPKTEIGQQTLAPGWVTQGEAREWVGEVYWMAPLAFLSLLEYGDIRRRLSQLQQLSPYPSIKPKAGGKKN